MQTYLKGNISCLELSSSVFSSSDASTIPLSVWLSLKMQKKMPQNWSVKNHKEEQHSTSKYNTWYTYFWDNLYHWFHRDIFKGLYTHRTAFSFTFFALLTENRNVVWGFIWLRAEKVSEPALMTIHDPMQPTCHMHLFSGLSKTAKTCQIPVRLQVIAGGQCLAFRVTCCL